MTFVTFDDKLYERKGKQKKIGALHRETKRHKQTEKRDRGSVCMAEHYYKPNHNHCCVHCYFYAVYTAYYTLYNNVFTIFIP